MRKNRRRRRITVFILLISTILCVVYLAPFFNITQNSITIIGADKTAAIVQEYLNQYVGRNINVYSMSEISADLEQIAYVADAKASRHFPNRLKVQIKEAKGVAQAKLGSLYYLFDESGKALENWYEMYDGVIVLEGLAGESYPVGTFIEDERLTAYTALMTEIIAAEVPDEVSEIDIADVSDIRFRIRNMKVEIGDADRLNYKFRIMQEVREELLPDVHGELDIKSGSKAYFREVYDIESDDNLISE